MNRIELLELVTKFAKTYSPEAIASIRRNAHMHEVTPDITIHQCVVDAVLVDFINYIGMGQGIDYALYAKDLKPAEVLNEIRSGGGGE